MNALRAGSGAVMCSYQRVNNSYACQNSKIMNGILKTELGFEGLVVSDWSAQHAGVATANAGLDINMPGAGFWGDKLVDAVKNGSVSLARLDDMATRQIATYNYLNQNISFPATHIYSWTVPHPILDVRRDHHKLIREVGAAGQVLVKNINNTLPLKTPQFMGVYGYGAETPLSPWGNPDLFGVDYNDYPNGTPETFNGSLFFGGGAGDVTPPYLISPFKAIQDRVIADRGSLRWDFVSVDPVIEASIDVCLVFINAYSCEHFDRQNLTDSFSDELINNVAGKCRDTVVVLHSGSPRLVESWIDHENVTAVILAGLPGQESGHSLVDVLYGDVAPSGKLTFTVAKQESDYPVPDPVMEYDDDTFPQDDFIEGVYIDYRHFDREEIEPRFEFGYGLSYTTFGYANLSMQAVNAVSTSEYPEP